MPVRDLLKWLQSTQTGEMTCTFRAGNFIWYTFGKPVWGGDYWWLGLAVPCGAHAEKHSASAVLSYRLLWHNSRSGILDEKVICTHSFRVGMSIVRRWSMVSRLSQDERSRYANDKMSSTLRPIRQVDPINIPSNSILVATFIATFVSTDNQWA